MKKLKVLSAAIVFSVIAFSCSDDDSSSTPVNGNANAITNNMKSGTWRISSYTDDGQNETMYYDGYNFDFNDNGTVVASNGVNSYNGTWSVTDSNSNDDDDNGSNDDIDFNLAFSAPEVFSELTDDWDVESRTGTKITLVDVSGGNGGTDYLVFEKN